jgi:hypothetical protein
LLAAMVNRVPRLVEFVRAFTIGNQTNKIDAKYLENIFNCLEKGWRNLYLYVLSEESIKCVSKAIIWSGGVLNVNEDVSNAIRASLLTNQVAQRHPSGKAESKFIFFVQPKLSLMILYCAVRETLRGGSPLSSSAKNFMSAFLKSIDTVIEFIRNPPTKDEIGIALDMVFCDWLYVRVTAACYLKLKSLTVADILGFPDRCFTDIKQSYHDLLPVFKSSISEAFTVEETCYQLNCTSCSNKIAYLEELEGIVSKKKKNKGGVMSEKEKKNVVDGVAFIKPCACERAVDQQESWDLCLKFFFSESDSVYIFFDNKSAKTKLNQALATVSGSEAMPNNAKEYAHTKEVLQSRNISSFLYIYATTHNVRSFSEEQAVELGISDTENILGPVYDLYAIMRAMI